MNRILLGAFCLFAATAAVSAETLDAGPFSVDITRLLIRYEAKPSSRVTAVSHSAP